MALVRYLTHPQVRIDADTPVPEWGLSALGQARIAALAASDALSGTAHVISSTERKAIETARPLADALGCSVQAFDDLGENDRSATGFMPSDEFEATADAFFANPSVSVRGWETADDAQARIVQAVDRVLSRSTRGDILFVGHGAVGTLLWCHLMDLPISRAHDQGPGGGGNWFAFDAAERRPFASWAPLETL